MNTFAERSESLDSDSSRERDGKVMCSSRNSSMAAAETTSRSTGRKHVDKKWNEYATAGIATESLCKGEGQNVIERGEVLWVRIALFTNSV